MNQNCCEKCYIKEAVREPCACPCHSPSSQEKQDFTKICFCQEFKRNNSCVHRPQPSAEWESQLRTKFLEKESPQFTSNELIAFIREKLEQAREEGYFAKISHYETKTIPNYYKTGVEAGRTAALKEVVEILDEKIKSNHEEKYGFALSDLKQSITSLIEKK